MNPYTDVVVQIKRILEKCYTISIQIVGGSYGRVQC